MLNAKGVLFIMITKKFDELFDKYKDGDYILERRIKVKLK